MVLDNLLRYTTAWSTPSIVSPMCETAPTRFNGTFYMASVSALKHAVRAVLEFEQWRPWVEMRQTEGMGFRMGKSVLGAFCQEQCRRWVVMNPHLTVGGGEI